MNKLGEPVGCQALPDGNPTAILQNEHEHRHGGYTGQCQTARPFFVGPCRIGRQFVAEVASHGFVKVVVVRVLKADRLRYDPFAK